MKDIPTPRTDSMHDYCHESCNADDIPVSQVLDSHQQLERELSEAIEQRDSLAEAGWDLIKAKGRFHTHNAYSKLAEVLSAMKG